MSTFPHDEIVLVLARETPFRTVAIERAVNILRALGWDAHQIRRGVNLVAGSGLLTLQTLITASELSAGDVDATLDALTPR